MLLDGFYIFTYVNQRFYIMIDWNGVFPAVTTKFDAHDRIDRVLQEKNLRAQLDAGVHGIILGGTLGEASTLTLEEKETLVKLTLDVCGGQVPVVLNIAEGSTKAAIHQAELAARWGASGLMLLPAMRYKTDYDETVTWFRDIASSTDLPVMIYNNPVDYRTEVTLEMFAELSSLSNIQAVKESTRDVSNVTRMINTFGNRYQILCGVDTLAMESLVMGAHGWVAGLVCAFPKETVFIYNAIKAGNIHAALEVYRWFLPLLELDIHPKLVQYIKLAEASVGLGAEYVRKPRLPLGGEERNRVLAIIEQSLKNRPTLTE